jgi:hypothetical protein
MGPGAISLVVKRPGREADHSSPSSADVKNVWSNVWSYTSATQYIFMAWCSVKSHEQRNVFQLISDYLVHFVPAKNSFVG